MKQRNKHEEFKLKSVNTGNFNLTFEISNISNLKFQIRKLKT